MNPAPAGTGVPTQIGPYRIEREIARGGMGIVYLARDTRLDRAAAIKALPDDVASDPDRLARFEREAKVLASLNHPNVAGIYGVEESGGRRYLALEHVEGEALAARIARGPLPLAETLEICSQIAAGVEAAHESGVIHRDLKPGNVMITPGEHVKVLDFGLAKGKVADESSAMRTGPLADSPTLSSPTLPHSPTGHSPATLPGVILGTAAYLSPEQARGKAVDRRTDIWSFGCVLYECLTGKRAFEGETVSDTIAKILERDVDWGRLPKSTPPRIRELLQRCFEKDARKRLRDIGEARLAIEDVRAGRSAATGLSGVATPPAPTTLIGRGREAMRSHGFLFALGLVAGALLALNMWGPLGSSAPHAIRGVVRLSLAVPADFRALDADLSPDGTMEAIRAEPRSVPGTSTKNAAGTGTGENRPRIYIRRLDKNAFEPLRGTEGARAFGFSPDSRWIGFSAPASERSAQVKIFRVPVDGSAPPVAVVDWRDEWEGPPVRLPSGVILVSAARGKGFVRIPADGGAPSQLIKFDSADSSASFYFRRVLPGERAALLQAISYDKGAFHAGIGVIDLKSGKARVLLQEGGSPFYASTGHLLYTRNNTLYAAPFDLKKLEITGEAVPIMDGLRIDAEWENAEFDLSDNGILQIAPGGVAWADRHAVIVGPGSAVSEWSGERRPFEMAVAVSPDGNRFATVISNSKPLYEIWVSERGKRVSRRVVAVPTADCSWPRWSPDGTRIAYTHLSRSDADGIYVTSVTGAEPPRRIYRVGSGDGLAPLSWSPDGASLLAVVFTSLTKQLVTLPVPPSADASTQANATTPRPLFQDVLVHREGAFAPDRHWIAFVSDQTGKNEVYVCGWRSSAPFGEPVLVSEGGGDHPMWSRGGRLYYHTQQDKIMSVTIAAKPELAASAPSLEWDLDALQIADLYDMLPDGRLLGIQKGQGEGEITRFDITLNFFDELKQRFKSAQKSR